MHSKDYIKRRKKKWRKYNSYQGEVGRILPNILDRNFNTSRVYEKAGTDVTMFPMEGESVYLSPIIDFHNREILSYAVGTNAKMDKIKYMLSELDNKHHQNIKGMILQSDQGVQY